jgi:hypothetical protein
MGRSSWFRRRLHALGEQYLLAVPSNSTIRDLEIDPPEYGGRGRHPKRPWVRVDAWVETLSDRDWITIDVRDGSKGPLIVEMVKRRVAARTDKRQEGPEEMLVMIRFRRRDTQRVVQTDYYFSNAPAETSEAEFARAAKAEHRIEECIQRGKSEAGLADYEVRGWNGWHHHQILSLIATWFLVQQARRGKKMDPGDHGSADSRGHQCDPHAPVRMRYTLPHRLRTREAFETQRACSPVSLETT